MDKDKIVLKTTVRLDKITHKKLRAFCKSRNISFQKLFEDYAKEIVAKYDTEPKQQSFLKDIL